MTRNTFDPYHQWLGIRPEEHPVDHYRLLGIVRFESDRDVIGNACDRLMSHVRKFQSGPRGAQSQEVLTRLAAARACLLNAAAKSTYDAVLHGQLAAAANVQASAAQRAAPMAAAYEPSVGVMPPPPPPPMLGAPRAPASFDFAAPPQANARVADDRQRNRRRPTNEVEYVEKPSPFYFQPWFPVLVVAGVLLLTLSVWGLGLMIGRARNEAAQSPVENKLEVGVPSTGDDATEPVAPRDETVYILQEAGGELNFTAGTALVEGHARLAEQGGQSVIDGITSVDDRVRWNFRVEKPGPFRIEATYAAPPGSEGGTFTLSAGEQTTKAIAVRNTGAAGEVTSERVGFLWVKRSGKHELVLTPLSIVAGQSLMTLHSLRFVPVGGSDGG